MRPSSSLFGRSAIAMHVQRAVFFTIDFDWMQNINSPVEHAAALPMAEKAAAGLIWVVVLFRLVCLGFSSIPSIDPNLWKPGLT